MYREHGCDGLIAVGGGSSLDCAKGVAIATTHPGPLVTYATIEGGSAKITAEAPPATSTASCSKPRSDIGAFKSPQFRRKMA